MAQATWRHRCIMAVALATTGGLLASGLWACGGGGGKGGGGGSPATHVGAVHSSSIAMTPDGRQVWSVNPDAGSVSVFDVAGDANAKVAEIPVGDEPWSLVLDALGARAFVANHGSDTVSVIDVASRTVTSTVGVGSGPYGVALTPNDGFLYVTTAFDASVAKIRVSDLQTVQVMFPPGATDLRGIAITNDGDRDDADETVFVTNFLSTPRPGAVAVEGFDDGKQGLVCRIDVNAANGDDTLGLAIGLPPALSGFSADRRPFCTSNGAVNDTFCGGASDPTLAFPNLLQSAFLRGGRLYLPSIGSSPEPPVRFDANVQALLSRVDVATGVCEDVQSLNAAVAAEPAASRLFPSTPWAIAFPGAGPSGYLVSAGSDFVLRVLVQADGSVRPAANADGSLQRVATGKNPRGIVVNPASTRAYVMNFVSRDVTAIDLTTLAPILPAMPSSILPAGGSPEFQVLRGKELFHSSRGGAAPGPTADGRDAGYVMSDNGWGSCFNCHPFGLADGVTWSFQSGPRQTVSLDGSFSKSSSADQRVLNWSAVRTSVQDFEKNTEGVSGGFGLIGPNGAGDGVVDHGANRGLSPDADAIEAYVRTVRTPRASSRLDPTAVTAGRSHFQFLACAQCHGGPKWSSPSATYSLPASGDPSVVIDDGQILSVAGVPVLRDVGTFDPTGALEIRGKGASAGQGALGSRGFNPPSLLGVGATAPYFHDGRYADLSAVVGSGHGLGGFPISPQQSAELVQFLRSIDAATAPEPVPP